jgi:hypothetical protein
MERKTKTKKEASGACEDGKILSLEYLTEYAAGENHVRKHESW